MQMRQRPLYLSKMRILTLGGGIASSLGPTHSSTDLDMRYADEPPNIALQILLADILTGRVADFPSP